MPISGKQADDRALDQKVAFSRRVLRHDIREYFISSILNGLFKPGERLVETRIAHSLGVSQGAVREALRELEWMGFLETKPFSGTYVKMLSVDDLQQIYPVRAELEALGARLALANLSDQDLDALQLLIDDMVRVSEQGDERGMVARNYEFHHTIMEAAKNSALLRAWSMFQFSYWTSITTAELRDDLVDLAQRHYKVLEGFRLRDPELAAQRMREHILELMDRLARLHPPGQAAATEKPTAERPIHRKKSGRKNGKGVVEA